MVTKNASSHDACVIKVMTRMTRFSDIQIGGESLVRSSMTHMTRFSDRQIRFKIMTHDAFLPYISLMRAHMERQPEHASYASRRGSR